MTKQGKIKVLLAQFPLETHSRGLLTVAGMLRDSGMEVVLMGNALPEQIVDTAVQEYVDVVGISTYCGGELVLGDKLLKAAEKKGIKDGDMVYLENDHGHQIQGKIHPMEGIHPQCLSMAKGMGRWVKGGQRLPGEKGSLMSRLIEIDLEHVCPICLNIENGVKVKMYKAEKRTS